MTVLVLLTLAYATGIALGQMFPVPAWQALAAAPCIILVLVVSVGCRRRLALVAVVGTLVLGWARTTESTARPGISDGRRPCLRLIQGAISQAPLSVGGQTRLVMDMESCSDCVDAPGAARMRPAGGRLYLTVMKDESLRISRGEIVRILVEPRPVQDHRNPGVSRPPRDESIFTGFLRSSSEIVRVESSPARIAGLLDDQRRELAAFWEGALDERESRLARALTLGESRALHREQRDSFRRTGAAHLLAVSGLHLAIVALIVFGGVRRILLRISPLSRRWDVGKFAALLTIPAIIAFAILVGGRAPVVRACVMATGLLLARFLGRKGGARESVCLAGAGLLAFEPSNIVSAGFQLSFSAVLGFLSMSYRSPVEAMGEMSEAGPACAARRFIENTRRSVRRLFMSTLAATAATTPIILYHFGTISLVSIPVNIMVVPYTSFLLMPWLLLVLCAALISPWLAGVLAFPAGCMLGLLEDLLEWISGLPCTLEATDLPHMVGISLLCLAVFLMLARRFKATAVVVAISTGLMLIAHLAAPRSFFANRLTIDFLDVGQGDATLVTFPDGRHWLVDAGGTATGPETVGERHLVPILRGLGVDCLESVVLTHPDPDHVTGMPAIFASIVVGGLWDNGQGKAEGAHPAYDEVIAHCAAHSIPISRGRLICGTRMVAGVRVEILHPCHDTQGYDPGLSFNDNSLVMHLSYGRTSFLLAGDLGEEGERILMERGAVPRSDVLKLGHHGSRNSSTRALLDLVRPSIGVASCGLGNRYGMPHRDVRRRLEERNIRLFRTDLNGAVRIVSDGASIYTAPMKSGKGK